jgi:hypothetical protein
VRITLLTVLKQIDIAERRYMAEIQSIIKASGFCFDLYEDRDVGRAYCRLGSGHVGPHKSSYLEWTGTHQWRRK